jgi:AcrR family transcriptional regulator
VRDIAQAAGVSPQTVYDSVGSKQALVSRLNDLIDAEAGVADIVRRAAESGDPWQMAATSARVTRSILERCGDIVHALAEGQRRHLEGARGVIGGLRSLEALDAAVDPDEAAETLAGVSDFRLALVLRDSYGWSLDRVESWIAATSRALLLGKDAPGRYEVGAFFQGVGADAPDEDLRRIAPLYPIFRISRRA